MVSSTRSPVAFLTSVRTTARERPACTTRDLTVSDLPWPGLMYHADTFDSIIVAGTAAHAQAAAALHVADAVAQMRPDGNSHGGAVRGVFGRAAPEMLDEGSLRGRFGERGIARFENTALVRIECFHVQRRRRLPRVALPRQRRQRDPGRRIESHEFTTGVTDRFAVGVQRRQRHGLAQRRAAAEAQQLRIGGDFAGRRLAGELDLHVESCQPRTRRYQYTC